MSDLNCSEYSEKAIVVRGESTKTYKEQLKTLGGKYNASLRGGAGWIFSKTSQGKVNKFISSVNNGDISPSSPVEERRTPVEERRTPVEERRTPVEERRTPVEERRTPVTKEIRGMDLRLPVILQDIKTLIEGKDSEYKLSFLSSVTLLLTQNSVTVPMPVPIPRTTSSLKAAPVPKAEVVISSDCEEEAPPRRRLLR